MPEDAAVAIFAKAPIPGFAKSRLIPLIGASGAATLQARLIRHMVGIAIEAGIGPVTLWGAPDTDHPAFRDAAARHGTGLRAQPEGDLGARMAAAFAASAGPLVLVGTDCPMLTPQDLRDTVTALRRGADAVIAPAEDGGYGLIAAARPIPELFDDMPWSTDQVAALTRARVQAAGLDLVELRLIWDVDTPDDYRRLRASALGTDLTVGIAEDGACL